MPNQSSRFWWWVIPLLVVSWSAAVTAAHRDGASTPSAVHETETGSVTDEAAVAGGGETAATDQEQERIWAELMEGNARFAAGTPRQRELTSTRKELLQGQHPRAIILGCSDSRVPPELIFDQGLGDLFVVRTAGNVADRVALGSLEYAVEHLHASLLVVLGHRKCGAVTAAASEEPMPTANLTAVMDRIAPAIARLKGKATGDRLVNLAVEANTYESAQYLLASSSILREAVETRELMVIKAVYEMGTGKVVRLR